MCVHVYVSIYRYSISRYIYRDISRYVSMYMYIAMYIYSYSIYRYVSIAIVYRDMHLYIDTYVYVLILISSIILRAFNGGFLATPGCASSRQQKRRVWGVPWDSQRIWAARVKNHPVGPRQGKDSALRGSAEPLYLQPGVVRS